VYLTLALSIGVNTAIFSVLKDDNAGEARTLAQYSNGEAKVREKAFDGGPAPGFAAVAFNERDIAKLAAGRGGGFFSGDPVCDEFLDFFFEVFADLVGEVVVEAVPQEQLF
jgi:hypothetical protein